MTVWNDDEFIVALDALARWRAGANHRIGSPEHERQMGEANAFAMARRLYLIGDER